MGIPGLLPFVKRACHEGSIDELRGRRVAVDVSCLLHRGVFACSNRFALGQSTTLYVDYTMKYVRLLRRIECHVVLVFDGRQLPAKQETSEDRRERRELLKLTAQRLMAEGRVDEAASCFRRATAVTREAVRDLDHVDVLVAPYEADAQLAFLASRGLVDAVITEDSDLIVFQCPLIIFKLELSGACLIFELSQLPKCLDKALASEFNFPKFRRICILAGCDYLQSGLSGVGLKKACQFFAKTDCIDLSLVLPRIPRYLNMPSLKVSKQFIADFIRAENSFLYQIVFDPRDREQKPLNPYPDGLSSDSFPYAGEVVTTTLAIRLALGNDSEKATLMDKFALPKQLPQWSIWNGEGGERPIEKEEPSCGAFQMLAAVRRVSKPSPVKTASPPPPLTRPRTGTPLRNSPIGRKRLPNVVWLESFSRDNARALSPLANANSIETTSLTVSRYFASSQRVSNPFKKVKSTDISTCSQDQNSPPIPSVPVVSRGECPSHSRLPSSRESNIGSSTSKSSIRDH